MPRLSDKVKAKGVLGVRSGVVHPPEAHNLVVRARAGTGKTWTLIGGVVWMMRDRCPTAWQIFSDNDEKKPSPQQLAIWEQMAIGSENVKHIRYNAFGNAIVNEFSNTYKRIIGELFKCGITLEFTTNHSLGFKALKSTTHQRFTVMQNSQNAINVATKLLFGDGEVATGIVMKKWGIMMMAVELSEKAKLWLIPYDIEDHEDKHHVFMLLDELCEKYNIQVRDHEKEEVYLLAVQIIHETHDFKKRLTIDFVDMIWLPCIHSIPLPQADLVIGDEAQDFNSCQQTLISRSATRSVVAGDDRQAIFGFAGADTDGLETMQKLLGMKRTCTRLNLTVTRRCGKRIVLEACRYVPDFEAHESNDEGEVLDSNQYAPIVEGSFDASYLSLLRPGDLVLSRTSGMIVRDCLVMLRNGHRAYVLGKEIGKYLIDLINKLAPVNMDDLQQKLASWCAEKVAKERAKEYPSRLKIERYEDTLNMIRTFMYINNSMYGPDELVEGNYLGAVDGLKSRIRATFSEPSSDSEERRIRFSTIHKAKGLEADNVFLHRGRGCEIPHKKAKLGWEREQEENLLYVAITRAKKRLTYVW